MIRFFAAHPTAANILMFVILLLGLSALPGLNKETFPEINPYKVQVTVAYPGASASEVEEGICNRLEDATDGISFLEKLMRLRPMPVVMISAVTEKGADVTLRALMLGAVDFIAKPKADLKNNLESYT